MIKREEVELQLEYLISKYIDDDEKKRELIDLVKKRGGPVAKGILAAIESCKMLPFDEKDSEIIQDIAFYYV
jgi:hypothetical protein